MKAHEAAKKLKMKSKEFCQLYDLASHLSKLSPDLEAELFGDEKKIIEAEPEQTETVDSAEAIAVEVAPEPVKEVCPFTVAEIGLGIRCLGNKSKQWEWRHLIG